MSFFAARSKVGRLLRDCEHRIAELDLPSPVDITALTRYLSTRTGRLIHLMPMALKAPALTGMWLTLPALDLVVYEANTTRTHQEHIIAHELAHIICGHRGRTPVDEATARGLFPNLDPALVRDMLGRAEYSDDHELEAEVMASLLLRHTHSPRHHRGTPAPEHRAVLDRLERSFTLAGSEGR